MIKTTKWFTLGAAATLFTAMPVFASEGHKHDATHAHQGANAEAGKHGAAAEHGKAAPTPNYGKKVSGRKVEVTVTKDGFVPAQISAKKGEVLNLVVTRKVQKTCATELVQKDQGVYAPLPLDKPVTVTLKAPQDGQLKFSCAHGHIAGNVVAQ
jgi:adenine/guanine phosphoribosyltransferase-like PRPP-binding protein